MKFALSSIGFPSSDVAALAARAKEWGYEGLELAEPSPASSSVKLDLPIVCLSSPVVFTSGGKEQHALADELRRHIDAAHQLNCPMVRIPDMIVRGRENRSAAASSFGQWLAPLGDYAALRRVTLVVQNAQSFRSARELWAVMEQANHPSIACCWDLLSAARIGEGPSISVPVLNSRIQYCLINDAKLTPEGVLPCKLGEGNVPVVDFLKRLRGIGYRGWTTFQPDPAWLMLTENPDAVLADAIKVLKQWTAAPAAPAPKAAPAHKPAAKPVSKPVPAKS